MQTNIAILAAQPFLKGLSERQLEVLAGDAMPAEFREGELIFREGDPANRFYILTSGKVTLEAPREEFYDEREPVLIETLGPGGVLGWSWMFPPYRWHSDAHAVTPVKAIFFYGTRLREQCEKDHELGYELMKRVAEIVVERLQATRHRLSEQSENTLALLPK